MNWTNAHSSTLDSYCYEETSETLFVRFNTGASYAYLNVEPSVAAGLRSSSSRGKYFGTNVRNRYEFKKFADEDELSDYMEKLCPEKSIATPEIFPIQWANCRLPAIPF